MKHYGYPGSKQTAWYPESSGWQAPGFGDRRKEMLQIILPCPTKGIRYQRADSKLEGADPQYLGRAASITIIKDNTTIVGGKVKEDINARVNQIKAQIEVHF